MTEHSLSAYINQRLSYLFLVLIIIVFAAVFFLLEDIVENLTYTYVYDLTINSVLSSLEYFDDTLIAYENSYNEVLTDIIVDFSLILKSYEIASDQITDCDLDSIFQELIENHSRELNLIGINIYMFRNIHYYMIDQNGVIIRTNNISQLNEKIENYDELINLSSENIFLDSFTLENNKRFFMKDAYLPVEGYLLRLGFPLDVDIFKNLSQHFETMVDNYAFLQGISIYNTLYTSDNQVFSIPSDEEKSLFLQLSPSENSIRKNLNRYSFDLYTYWENDSRQINFDKEPYYIKLRMDYSDNILLLSRTLTVFVCLILFLALLSVFLLNRYLSQKITTPFNKLAENMNNMGLNNDLSNIDESIEKTGIREVNMLLASYQEMTGELCSYFQELKAVNEELEDSYRETSVLAENLHNVIQVTTKLTDNIYSDKESFIVELFYVAKKLIPEADYGSVFVVENNKIKWLETIGHKFEDIENLSFDLNYFKTLEEVFYIKKLNEDGDYKYSKLIKEMLVVKKPIKSFIIVQLFVGDELAGALNFDISKESNLEFSRQSIETIKAFANLSSAFLTMQSYRYIHEKFQREIILAIINILEIHDSYTKGHSENVSRIAALIAEEMGLSSEEIKKIEWAGLVHDIGKILISKSILNKKGVLTADEYNEIKKHSVWGYEVLLNSEELREIAIYVRHHHERWDGTGYPDELEDREIPLIARILALADSWDTMRSDRVYRSKLPKEVAIQELKDNRGKQFAPEVVDAALKLIEEGILE